MSDRVIDLVDTVAIMDYRTEAGGSNGTVAHAADELAYATRVGKTVQVALETTFIPDEPGRTIPSFFPALPATVDGLKTAVVTIVSSMFISLVGMFALSRFLPSMPLLKTIVPDNPMPTDVLVEDPYRGGARVGDVGRAEGPLHPAGKARFGAQLVDVVTQGEFLETDATVEVVERRGNRVVVRATR